MLSNESDKVELKNIQTQPVAVQMSPSAVIEQPKANMSECRDTPLQSSKLWMLAP